MCADHALRSHDRLGLYQRDTQIVSILYRTHKSLPTVAKVSSLYVFDALSRAARHQVSKQGLTGDINSETGNCATFLLKVEGVLEGLFQDMIMVGSPESKVSYFVH
jgi:protein NRD1